MFGYTARHVITRTSETYEPADARGQSEAEVDGWYIDPPAAWLGLHPPRSGRAYLTATTNPGVMDDVKFTDTGNRETGFPLLVTRTHRSMGHTTGHREEVTEFSEAPLDPGLFVPLENFKRVLQLPGAHAYPYGMRIRLRWEMLKDRLLGQIPG